MCVYAYDCVCTSDLAAGIRSQPSPCLLFPVAAVKAESACYSSVGKHTHTHSVHAHTRANTNAHLRAHTQMFRCCCFFFRAHTTNKTTDAEIAHTQISEREGCCGWRAECAFLLEHLGMRVRTNPVILDGLDLLTGAKHIFVGALTDRNISCL